MSMPGVPDDGPPGLAVLLRDAGPPVDGFLRGAHREVDAWAGEVLWLDGAGILVELARAAENDPGALVELASQVQDAVVEMAWSRGLPTAWPPCPRHPGTHPLSAGSREGGVAVWTCPRDGVDVAPIGSLLAI